MDDNIETVERVILFLVACHPRAQVPADTIEAYVQALADVEPATLKQAALKCVSDIKFFPAISEIRQAVVEVSHAPKRAGVELWGQVVEARRLHDVKHPPGTEDVLGSDITVDPPVIFRGVWDFDDPILRKAVDSVGWPTVHNGEDDTVKWMVVKAYDAIQARELDVARQVPQVQEVLTQLAGKLDGRRQLPRPTKRETIVHD